MAIDDCPHSFEDLVRKVLPAHMARLRPSLNAPIPVADFAVRGVGTKTLLTKHNRSKDFSGCYVLIEKKTPIYVGISRTVFQRLLQHVKGKTHFDASLAYRIAVSEDEHRSTRSGCMASSEFQRLFDAAKDYLKTLNVAYVEIANPLELYVFEPFCAITLNTHQWNTFRTH